MGNLDQVVVCGGIGLRFWRKYCGFWVELEVGTRAGIGY